MASGILAWNGATNAGVEWTAAWPTTNMGDLTIVYRIIALELRGLYMFTALLKVIKYPVDRFTGNLTLRYEVWESGRIMDT